MDAGEWLAEQHAADQRRFLHVLGGSALAHVAAVGLMAFAPSAPTARMPDVLRVDLVAALPPAPTRAPAPPAPVAQPQPQPKPQPKQVVLPKQAPKAVPSKRVPPPPPKPAEPVNYEDALSQLRNELGETAPPIAPPADETQADVAPQPDARSTDRGGMRVDAELAAWHLSVRRHLRSCWITPPEFLNRPLTTGVRVRLGVGGTLIGTPAVIRPSGDPWFDENTVRAIVSCGSLPSPPEPGLWAFSFTSEQR